MENPLTPPVQPKPVMAHNTLHHFSPGGSPRSVKSSNSASGKAILQKIHLTLSRPMYRPGTAVVGTIRLGDDVNHQHQHHHGAMTGPPPPPLSLSDTTALSRVTSSWKSVRLYVVGYCRLDNRWHKTSNYRDAYGNNSDVQTMEDSSISAIKALPRDLPDRQSVFWACSVPSEGEEEQTAADLLKIHEQQRQQNNGFLWEEVKPRPIQYTEDWADQVDPPLFVDSTTVFPPSEQMATQQSHPCLAFTFRANLPHYLPSTLSMAVSCRYSYSVLLRLQSHSGSLSWVEKPILVQQSLSASPSRPLQDSSALLVQANTGGLPYPLTATELYGACPKYQKGALTVHRFSGAFHVNSAPGPVLRITDPLHGQPVSILTVLAPTEAACNTTEDDESDGDEPSPTQIALCPGSRMYLQFDFPCRDVLDHGGDNNGDNSSWVKCYQVSACLQGEESVLPHNNAASSTTPREKRQRAQQMLLSTAHKLLDPETSQRVSLCLLVPDSALCSVQTPAVDISYECLVDIVVASPSAPQNGQTKPVPPKYRNLRLRIPCSISHSPTAEETMTDFAQEQEDAQVLKRQQELWEASFDTSKGTRKPQREDNNAGDEPTLQTPSSRWSFPTEDIVDDMKRLSILMAEENGWV